MIQASRVADGSSTGRVRALALAVLAFLLGTCAASGEAYQTWLEGWVGKTKSELVEQFGPPQRSERAKNRREILFWSSARDVSQGSRTPIGGGFSFGLSVKSESACELSFTLVDGVAKSFDWKADIDSLFGKVELRHSRECGVAFPIKPRE